MKILALLAVVVSAAYYYHLLHPETAAKLLPQRFVPVAAAKPAPAAPKPQMHYHSPLDVSSSRGSAGYYSAEAPEHYEVTGQRSTASGRAALLNPPDKSHEDGEDLP